VLAKKQNNCGDSMSAKAEAAGIFPAQLKKGYHPKHGDETGLL
jgi:hypothetical protein